MTDDSRVEELLDKLLDSQSTPESVCAACPELIPQVHERWRQICNAQAELDVMFPPAAEQTQAPTTTRLSDILLPTVPGYEVESVLGVGGMGVVFRARQLALNRVVALKMVLAGAYASPLERSRFRREAEAVAALTHPNVVQIHEVGEADGRPYFTMEYVGGGSLARKIAATPQPAHEAAKLVATLAEAIHAAHIAKIVHRDLKPSNVLLTSDGTPKITDFGLARRVGDEAGLTRTGAAVGTPSYMAPEQAQGQADSVGPAADIYALGAILYELLTGRPPFLAESAAETVLQVLARDPVPPSRLNGKVPRDLETICLKCLHKEPKLRYATASALAEDVQCFLRGEAIAARPEGPVARLGRKIRRRPALAAAVAVSAILAIILTGGGVWFLSDRSATKRAAEGDLRDMAQHLRASAWPEAGAARERAKGRLGNSGPAGLRQVLDQCTHELELALRLDGIRLEASGAVGGVDGLATADESYAKTFREAGLAKVDDAPKVVAERINESNIRNALIAAFDHWSICARDPRRRDWILLIVREADGETDKASWRSRARDPEVLKNQDAMKDLIRTIPIKDAPVALLLVLDVHYTGVEHREEFLKRIHHEHPDDFWTNHRLGFVMYHLGKPWEAVGFYHAALAVRPESALVHNNLGHVLAAVGRNQEALAHFERAVSLDPTSNSFRLNLALALNRLGRHDDAIAELESALRMNPSSAILHSAYGLCLENKGQHDEAFVRHNRAVSLEPTNTNLQKALRAFLNRSGRTEDMRVVWQAALAIDPPEHDAWYGYAELCLFLGQVDEYRRARKALLDKFGTTSDPKIAERVGRACLLLPMEGDELRRAVVLADRALAADRAEHQSIFAHFQFVKGLANYRQKRFDQAIKELQGGPSRLGSSTQLVLAMALYQAGQHEQAKKALESAIRTYDWRPNQIRDQDGWICHVLRREAEAMIRN